MEWELKGIDIIVTYNPYLELQTDIEEIGNKIQNLNITSKYKININQSPVVISGRIPLYAIEFYKDDYSEGSIPYLVLSLDQSTLRLGIREPEILNLENYKSRTNELIQAFEKIWKEFNSIADRTIIERLGFISLSMNNEEGLKEKISSKLLKKDIEYQYYSLRFFEFIEENIEPLKNTKVVRNMIIDPELDEKTHEFKGLKLVNDIATIPSSKGIIKIDDLIEGINLLKEISIENLERIKEVIDID